MKNILTVSGYFFLGLLAVSLIGLFVVSSVPSNIQYGDQVKVTSGFYEGCSGPAIDVSPNPPDNETFYSVALTSCPGFMTIAIAPSPTIKNIIVSGKYLQLIRKRDK